MLTIRCARAKDCGAIWRVHTRAIRELAAGHYAPAEIEAWAGPRRPEHYYESILRLEFYVAELADGIVGFGVLNQETGEVEAVYVAPEYALRGVGSALLRQLEERARALGLTRLHLDSSLNARPFYAGAGYAAQHPAKHRLRSGVEIACVRMTKELPGTPRT